MQETDLVMELIQALEKKQCNGHAKVKLGTALADPDKFRSIFTQFSKGTYFEDLELELEEVPPVISCSCGYRKAPRTPEELSTCPSCSGVPELERGVEFEIVEPSEER